MTVKGEKIMDVRTCRNCRRLFNWLSGPQICQACRDEAEKKFQSVKDYIRENPHSTINDISEAMEVSVQQIKQWVREERLEFTDAMAGGITCERCGAPIVSGRYCKDCVIKVKNDLMSGLDAPKEQTVEKKSRTADSQMRFL